ncbi:MAG: hypothetical protein M3442_19755 [Chloroflexota bacterium]|nr:hypothetical protein [Chloroflexota bacterium]
MAYCERCRIGTIDEAGLCRLCGTPQHPPSRRDRLAEAGGALLATLLQPAVLGTLALAVLLLTGALLTGAGARAPAGLSRPGVGLTPQGVMAAARSDPGGIAIGLLLPALVQAIIFGLLLLALVIFLRRRRGSNPPERRLTS